MKIKGFQKLTLIDYPEKLACILFLFGCNFKCGFCYNPELVVKQDMQEYKKEDILDFLESRKKYLDGVCITGGEPLMSLDINFIRKIKAMGYKIKIDTNGCYPEKLQELINEGLVDYVAMDIKGTKELYAKITNSEIDFSKIEESIGLISSLPDYEFRTTITERYHNKENIGKMMEWLKEIAGKKLKKFALQGFKNKGKMIDDSFENEKEIKKEYLEELKEIADEYFEEVVIRV